MAQISSPLPGVFYQRPDPDSPPFKARGDAVAPGDTLGLVEVMKSFLPIEAEVAGTFDGYTHDNATEISPGDVVCEVRQA